MVLFTIASAEAQANAQVLGITLGRFHPKLRLSVVDLDGSLKAACRGRRAPIGIGEVIPVAALPIPEAVRESLLFTHGDRELERALQPFAFEYFLKTEGTGAVFLDARTMLFSPLTPVLAEFSAASVLLSPHCLHPGRAEEATVRSERLLSSGMLNSGFVGLVSGANTRALLTWWKERLLSALSEGRAGAEQPWIDLIPIFFPDHKIVRHSGHLVTSANVAERNVGITKGGSILAEGKPLISAQFPESPDWNLVERSETFRALLSRYQNLLSFINPARGYRAARRFFSNGDPILQEHRRYYRERPDAIRAFPTPREISRDQPCFLEWYKRDRTEVLTKRLALLEQEVGASLWTELRGFVEKPGGQPPSSR